ncbi:CDP-diacylglycerol--glycerol-3-phosphate 3-phosphatidyltransferase [Stackebrandtia albiflava]|uniref:CDP-diacylglycerol--glycerol-3-phosphate 3-phosphatidyltransferase n=1 Tax=Stackebrandtia albiflava TaxID=406432 RepID=A0A562VB45_9ACTN|nr:hypothetical protein [Stackebrandtia albiflava]TWJ15083.1 CDP-diacylglycerol--glycerol-3-phosphate 3-phosphatidyltransferase [Stackebrandtia albiflava]
MTPTSVTVVGLVAGVITPFIAQAGGLWLVPAAVSVAVVVACDRWYPSVARRFGDPTRRVLVFVPLSARLVEVAWLYGFHRLGVPTGVLIGAGAVTILHEYLRARGQIAGLREVALSTLGERSSRLWSALAGYGVAAVVSVTGTAIAPGMVTGVATIAAIAWLLLGVLGLVQLMIVVSAALRGR